MRQNLRYDPNWGVFSRKCKHVIAYMLGDRTDEACRRLLALLTPIKFSVYCTDDWGAYRRLLPWEKHLISQQYTQNIECQNLNFRTHIKRLARRTISGRVLLPAIYVAINDNISAKQLYKDRFDYDDGLIMEIAVWELPVPVVGSEHRYKYSLFYGNAEYGRLIGYDNERPKGDHRHYGNQEEPYTLSSIEQLISDFISDVARIRRT